MWTTCAVKSHSWAGTGRSTSEELCHLVWNRVHKSLTFGPVPIQLNPAHNLQINFFQIDFNGILPYMQIRTTLKYALTFGVSVITVNEFLACHACRMSYRYYLSRVYLPNNILWILIMNSIIIQSSAFCICSSVHRNSRLKDSNRMQLYADIYLLLNYSTCFGRPSHPSSGVHKTVVAASGTDHTIWVAR